MLPALTAPTVGVAEIRRFLRMLGLVVGNIAAIYVVRQIGRNLIVGIISFVKEIAECGWCGIKVGLACCEFFYSENVVYVDVGVFGSVIDRLAATAFIFTVVFDGLGITTELIKVVTAGQRHGRHSDKRGTNGF